MIKKIQISNNGSLKFRTFCTLVVQIQKLFFYNQSPLNLVGAGASLKKAEC